MHEWRAAKTAGYWRRRAVSSTLIALAVFTFALGWLVIEAVDFYGPIDASAAAFARGADIVILVSVVLAAVLRPLGPAPIGPRKRPRRPRVPSAPNRPLTCSERAARAAEAAREREEAKRNAEAGYWQQHHSGR